ncbi:MAG: hypothetical protein E6K58_13155 [Nitrospirae bacterium]|nr:MAG: hypothetical protein E6K58_13155 [Nitrospirota bacterium]
MPIPTLQGVQVQAETTFDPATGRYTYGYTVSNPAGNTGRIWNVLVDMATILPRGFGSIFFDPEGLTIPLGTNLFPFDRELGSLQPLALPAGTTLVPFGQQVPTGWNGGLRRNGVASFSSSGPEVHILPGQTLSGFALVGPGMPMIRNMEVHPKWTYVVPDVHVTDPEEEEAAGQVEQNITFRTFTLGPSAQTLGTFAHWDQVRDDLNQAIQLGWISDQALANALVSQLAAARQALDDQKGTDAKIGLNTLIQTITASTPDQRRREAFDLIFLNTQRLIEGTANTVFPVEPKLKLSPQSSTLPVGTLYTLTGTVINAGNPANPPIPGFRLGFLVVEGPHGGQQLRGVTDAQGKLSFSYTGTQAGTDKITAGIFDEVIFELGYAEVTWSGGPDLVVPLFAPPLLKSEGGKTVFITEWTSNLGSLPSSRSITRYFISADAQLDPATAQVIGERAIPALAPGERSEGGTVTFTLPSNVPAGVYHLAACADAGMTVGELNEDNNCSFSEVLGQTSVVLALEPEAITNQPPTVQAGPDQTVGCQNPSGATVTLNGTASSDPDGDPLTFTWTDSFGTVQGPTPQVTLPLGTHTVTLTVDDGKGGIASGTVKITVVDTKSPAVTAALTPLASEKKGLKRREREGDERERRGDEGKRGDDDDDRRDRDGRNEFRVVAQAMDRCDAHPPVQAAINGVPVIDGQVVRLELDDDNKVRRKNGLLQIAARNILLTVSATDASGNRATATAKLAKKQREHDD